MNVDENKRAWDGKYHWSDRGDEWSAPWGGPARQWHGAILPRLLGFLPARRIVEIACGCGRMTQFLKDGCEHLIAVDLSEQCIAACRERFAADPKVECHVNDGRSLAMVPDGFADLVFSFDSLVHADAAVMEAYIGQLPRLLSAEGVAFLHHSNLASYQAMYRNVRRVRGLEKGLVRMGLLDQEIHWRDYTVDARLVEELAVRNGLRCITQEIFRWRTRRIYNDCISVLVRQCSRRDRPPSKVRNARFMDEAARLLNLSRLYA